MTIDGRPNSIELEPIAYFSEVMGENDQFLKENASDVYSEIVGLANDCIDYVGAVSKDGKIDVVVKCAGVYFLNHVLNPICGAIWVNSLNGNIPACFMELRLALESLVKCFYADLCHSGQSSFQDRMKHLETQLKNEKTSISKLMKIFDKEFGLGNEAIAMWGKLSSNWLHAKGFLDRIVDGIAEQSEIPSWGLVVPISYSKEDLRYLDELKKELVRYRRFLKKVMQKYGIAPNPA